MISLFKSKNNSIFVVETDTELTQSAIKKLSWAFSDATIINNSTLEGYFVGPRKEMITPASTNAVEICKNMGVNGILRIEEFYQVKNEDADFDSMLFSLYKDLNNEVFTLNQEADPIIFIDNINKYNLKEGLALSNDEVKYLDDLSNKLNRKLTDSEIFGFAQVNSEHCRHKIFNGTFIIDGEEKKSSLFQLIKKTSKVNHNTIVSAYKDNCSFTQGPKAMQFAPLSHDKADYFAVKEIETVLALKAETHNFPTTVEPFNGAATGAGGEIRDRMAGGKASVPMAGTAVYMTSYPRLKSKKHEQSIKPRNWLYQTPKDILIKASNGASDFGNKFGQPLINGSLLTFEHEENDQTFGFDKVIMLAGGIGYAKKEDALKEIPSQGDKVIVIGGDNYRIGIGGGAVSSVATGEFDNKIELNAVQRSNPEMQKRAFNVIRAFSESDNNPVITVHDHGAGGHLNCLSELVEETGGEIYIDKLPIGDKTLSAKEIVGNESQERIGFVTNKKHIPLMKRIAERERSPFYEVGQTTCDNNFSFVNTKNGEKAIDLSLTDFFGNPPKTIINDTTLNTKYKEVEIDNSKIEEQISEVLKLESVACKDWLTNKVDRSVTGKVACQQTVGEIQLPLSDLGAVALDYKGEKGIATSLGHAPAVSMIDSAVGSKMAIAEALTNIVFAPLTRKIKGLSLSANWMWPCKNPGEDARLYKAVEAVSEFSCNLGLNVPTGKDSLSMTQKYPNNKQVISPGTVIISASGEVSDIKKIVKPNLNINSVAKKLVYIDFSKSKFELGGSAFAQIQNRLGNSVCTIEDDNYFITAFNTVQSLIEEEKMVAGHDISEGGLITCLLEMCFADNKSGVNIDLSCFEEKDLTRLLFSEKPAIICQTDDLTISELNRLGVDAYEIGEVNSNREFIINNLNLDINKLRDTWFETSYLLDRYQSGESLAAKRFANYKTQELKYDFLDFEGKLNELELDRTEKTGVKAAIIREKGSNGEREMAYAMHLAGFDVKDVHMTDLMSGRETLADINFIVFVGGFSNSDVLGSAKGWAGAFKFNENANTTLKNFYNRKNTLSLGVCNGCQLMGALDLISGVSTKLEHNDSMKFESTFVGVKVNKTESILLKSLEGKELGIWVAHGEGKFKLSEDAKSQVALEYSYSEYPANPNNSDLNAAGVCSSDGRHLAMMPHLERAIFPWQWAHYPSERSKDEVSPWIEAFANAKTWIVNNK